jgi:hypothetical protein
MVQARGRTWISTNCRTQSRVMRLSKSKATNAPLHRNIARGLGFGPRISQLRIAQGLINGLGKWVAVLYR